MPEICVNSIIEDSETGARNIVLWIAPGNAYGYWYDLNSSSRTPSEFNAADITEEENHIRYEISAYSHPDISIADQELLETDRKHRDRLWSMMRTAVEHEPDIYEKKSRAAILQTIAEENGIKPNNLYKLLDKYWRSGKTKNAFLPQFSKRGGKGITRKQKEKKIGRQSSTDNSTSKILTEGDFKNFEQAVRKYYYNQQKRSFVSTYEKLLEKFYTKKACNGVLKLLEPSERPSFRQFQYWYYKNRNIAKEKKKRDGERAFELTNRAVLGKSDFGLMGPGAQFQVDATIGDVHLVSQFDRSKLIGRPIIYFIIDAFSRMVVGMSVGLEGPSWNALASAVVNMASDKVAFCRQYGIEITKDEWPCHHIPTSLLGDRGELESKNADNLVSMFGIRVMNAPPYRGDLKGIIEQHFRTINLNGVKQLPGSVDPEMNKRGGHDYRLDSTLDIRQITKILIKCVLHYNNHHYMDSFEKNEAMMASNVDAVPLKLWEWGIQNYSGALRPFPEDVVKLAVLPVEKATVTARGIRFKGLFYSCETATTENWFEKARSTKTWPVKVSYNPGDMENIYIWSSYTKQYETCYLLDWNNKHAGKTLVEIIDAQQSERLAGQRIKTTETESKVNLNADIDAIVAEAAKMSKSAPAKTKIEKLSNIRENRADEREAMRDEGNAQNQYGGAVATAIQGITEPEISSDFHLIKAKLEERLKNGRV